MKKVTSLILALALTASVALCGCQNNDEKKSADENTYTVSQDYQYEFSENLHSGNMCKSDVGYYFTYAGYLYFVDEGIMQSTPLCNKPNCLHDNKDQCNAYIGATDGINYYDGYIYYIQSEYDNSDSSKTHKIIRCSKDGESKEVLAQTENCDHILLLVHKGCLYYTQTSYTATDNAYSMPTDSNDSSNNIILDCDTKLYRIDLSNKDETPEVYAEMSDFGDLEENKSLQFSGISANGNYLLLRAETVSRFADTDGNGGGSYNDDPDRYYTLKLETKEIINLNKAADIPDDMQFDNITYLDGKIIYTLCKPLDPEKSCPTVYTINFDGTDKKEVFTTDSGYEHCKILTDSDYIYFSKYQFNADGYLTGGKTQIYDHSFKLINTAKMPVNYSCVGEKIMDQGYNDDSEFYVRYTEKSELINPDSTPKWENVFTNSDDA